MQLTQAIEILSPIQIQTLAFFIAVDRTTSECTDGYIPLTLEISTDAQSLIGFGVICEGYICQQLVPVGCYLRGALLSRAGT